VIEVARIAYHIGIALQVVAPIGLQQRDFVMQAIIGPARLPRVTFAAITCHGFVDVPDGQPALGNELIESNGLSIFDEKVFPGSIRRNPVNLSSGFGL
jgi:hypothetical protein